MGIRKELLESHGDEVALETHGETSVSPVRSIANGKASAPHSVSPVRSIDGDECRRCSSSLYEHGKFISTELRTR